MTKIEQDRADLNQSILRMYRIIPPGKPGRSDVPIQLHVRAYAKEPINGMENGAAAQATGHNVPPPPSGVARNKHPIERQTPTGFILRLVRTEDRQVVRNPVK